MTKTQPTTKGETMTSEILNQAAEVLRVNGIEPTKDLVFSACIMTLTNLGMETREAVDTVLGTGRFNEIASKVYDNLNA